MPRVLLCGAGKIGRMIAKMLHDSGDFELRVGDADVAALEFLQRQTPVETVSIDANDRDSLAGAMHECDVVISALSFHFNPLVAEVALETGASYFDLTEDIETTRRVRAVSERAAKGQIFMPQCGLAPGFVSIVAHHLTKEFDRLDTVEMRVGALPQFPTKGLKYNLTWSTDGLINEYCNPCEAIHENQHIDVLPLEGLELFSLDGVRYEAFNTSGGLGTLCETLNDRVRELNYKTIRYQGHRDLMAFLIGDLRLGDRRDILKDILENAVPITYQDVVVVFCNVSGWRGDRLVQLSDARKIYNEVSDHEPWSAIQITTAAGMCTAVDLHREGKLPSQGFVRQEDIDFDDFLANRFGKAYDSTIASRFTLD